MESIEGLVYIAKLAEQAKRYDDMVDAMKKVAKLDVELTFEERNLLSVGYKNVIGSRRESWLILSSIEQKEETRANETSVERLKEYRNKIETEISNICSDIMVVIDDHLIPSASTVESTFFYYQMKGDCYRDLAEFKSAAEKEEAVELSMKAYKTAASVAEAELPIPATTLDVDEKLRQRFEQWMKEYGRVYCNETEKEKSYWLGLNQFGDLTQEEVVKRC